MERGGYPFYTNQRVYRPLGYYFYLDYNNGTYHYSANNSTDNPFYFAPSGYVTHLDCVWYFQSNQDKDYVSPVTCQDYA